MPRKTAQSHLPQPHGRSFNEAAARCRGKPTLGRGFGPARNASMRPRPDAAENSWRDRTRIAPRWGFNEAAARCRGKLGPAADHHRPHTCFNEAAARCRGKRLRQGVVAGCVSCFNEAAARCRGKRWKSECLASGHVRASMRPRPDAAENGD